MSPVSTATQGHTISMKQQRFLENASNGWEQGQPLQNFKVGCVLQNIKKSVLLQKYFLFCRTKIIL